MLPQSYYWESYANVPRLPRPWSQTSGNSKKKCPEPQKRKSSLRASWLKTTTDLPFADEVLWFRAEVQRIYQNVNRKSLERSSIVELKLKELRSPPLAIHFVPSILVPIPFTSNHAAKFQFWLHGLRKQNILSNCHLLIEKLLCKRFVTIPLI